MILVLVLVTKNLVFVVPLKRPYSLKGIIFFLLQNFGLDFFFSNIGNSFYSFGSGLIKFKTFYTG